ncbi:MAG TPA: hypothetical protein VLH85_03900, partial [Levilinea sp.]|nr:hypothetical protein [Levilinea sp.]
MRKARKDWQTDQPMDRKRNCRRDCAAGDFSKHFTSPCNPVAQKRGLKPHLIRYWLTPDKEKDKRFDEKVKDINELYHQAPKLAEKGEAVISTDEMTGVQALERKHPGL